MNRLRLQLIGILVLAIVLPLLPAAFAARELFQRSLDPLLASGLYEGAEAGLQVTRDVMESHKAAWRAELANEKLELLQGPEVRTTDSTVVLVAEVRRAGAKSEWLTRALPESLATQAARLSRGMQLLQALRLEHGALQRGFEATFLVVYLAMAAAVLALGLLLTSRLTRPLADLAQGIDRIAAGDLGARVPERGSGEVAELMRHFNAMGERLHTQQEELGRLERLTAWRQTARFLAHEIKNPLTPIQLAAEQMRDAYRGDDEKYRELVRESAAIIQEEVLGMRNLVSEFSQFARLPEIRAARVPAEDLARELQALYGAAQLAVTGADGVSPWCDRDQLKRVLVNLVDNALAAQRSVSHAGPVELSFAAAADGAVRVAVRDHGPGVPDERKRRVFEPDYTTKSDGMGLGLAIVEHIVLHHGGAIRIHDAPGSGAVFEITLSGTTPAGGAEA